jgi:hypothetical protein
MRKSWLWASLMFAAACSGEPAFADQVAGPQMLPPRVALEVAPAKLRAPYDVQILRDNGDSLPTFASHGRFYVEGNVGERYLIRITNPTANRVEAVISVDGLDVIDGETADTKKRGYIVPPYGETRIEGFRTSLADVATFRFSSVDGSYAGQQGKARNVGVIAVALFEENVPPEQQVIVGDKDMDQPPPPRPIDRLYEGGVGRGERAVPAPAAAPPSPSTTATASKSGGGYAAHVPAPMGGNAGPAKAAKARRVANGDDAGGDEEGWLQPPAQPQEYESRRTERLGLGTEFGEQRYSSATYTRFMRAPGRPVAIAELRYNDAAGLIALGIPAQPLPDEGEIMTRETADPFPGDSHFSRAP